MQWEAKRNAGSIISTNTSPYKQEPTCWIPSRRLTQPPNQYNPIQRNTAQSTARAEHPLPGTRTDASFSFTHLRPVISSHNKFVFIYDCLHDEFNFLKFIPPPSTHHPCSYSHYPALMCKLYVLLDFFCDCFNVFDEFTQTVWLKNIINSLHPLNNVTKILFNKVLTHKLYCLRNRVHFVLPSPKDLKIRVDNSVYLSGRIVKFSSKQLISHLNPITWECLKISKSFSLIGLSLPPLVFEH